MASPQISAPQTNGSRPSAETSPATHTTSRFTPVNGERAGPPPHHHQQQQQQQPPPQQQPPQMQRPPSGPPATFNGSPQKRKRSESDDIGRPRPATDNEVSATPSTEKPPTDGPNMKNESPPQGERREQKSGPPQMVHMDARRPDDEHRDVARAAMKSLRDESSWTQADYDSQSPDNSEDNLDSQRHGSLSKDHMRRSQSMDGDGYGLSGDESDRHSTQMTNGEFSQDRSVDRNGQMDARRRKRVFSNRTKTGCMTCRRRKKKCDEAKPECNNCHRGGFVCEGYNIRTNWRPQSGARPVNVQMKEVGPMMGPDSQEIYGHGPYGERPHPHGPPAPPPHPHHRPEISPPPYVSRPVHDPRPIVIYDDDRPPYDRRQEHRPEHRGPPPPPQPPGYPEQRFPPRMGHENSGGPPPPPQQQQQQPPPPPPQQPNHVPPYQQGRPPMPESGPPPPHHQQQHPPPPQHQQGPPNAPPHPNSMVMQHHRMPRPLTEKEKMLSGDLYSPSTPELVDEREQCRAACWRFNNSSNPTIGVSREERARLFLDILRPRQLPGQINGGTPVSPIGSVGDDVVVEAPFYCDYGYNITIGDGVYIGPNCRILDPTSVLIKARTYIGPDVKIYAATHPIDPRKRNGSRGAELARRVIIDEDCWLGGGVTILPGICIGRGSTVGAGSVVTREVPPFTVVAGNPARVIRGIYQNGGD